ncbi:MAG: GNAT family N-acetyltransferase [Magnetococcales bacterium]|nr:GNAT family N-acetyltransferase [Magnetococcales bacterium]
MSVFLKPEWLAVMRESGGVSDSVAVEVADRVVHVGVVRALGHSRWVLFGSWEHPSREQLRQLMQCARHAGAFAVESRFNMARWPEEVVIPLGAEVLEPFGTYRVDLTQSGEALWQGLHPKHRNAVRRAMSVGVEVRASLDRELFRESLQATYRRGGRDNPFRAGYFDALWQHMSASMLVMSVWHQGGFQAGALIPFDGSRGYYLHGATIDHPEPGAANLLHWEIMRALRERGVGAYDLGGARLQSADPRLQGIFRFKERFGGVFEPCCYWRGVVHARRAAWFRTLDRVRTWWTMP